MRQSSPCLYSRPQQLATLKIFGGAKSRAIRSLWAIEETGVPFEHIAINTLDEMRGFEFLAVNPNGKIPALLDGELAIFESMCINLYLAENYAPALLPKEDDGRTQAIQWSFWAISEIEPLQMDILNNTKFLPKDKRNPAVAELALKRIQRPLRVLEEKLASHPWLVSEYFTLADLNLASVMLLLEMSKFDYSSLPQTRKWLDECYARPALKKAQAR